jgi:hypothetical protein
MVFLPPLATTIFGDHCGDMVPNNPVHSVNHSGHTSHFGKSMNTSLGIHEFCQGETKS